MALRLPTHSIDAEMAYISRRDDAWDHDKIEREAAEIEGEHPVATWLRGEHRFDLAAEMPLGDERVTVRDYLDGTPTLWILQRMRIADYGRLEATHERMLRKSAESGEDIPAEEIFAFLYEACKLGLREVRDGDFELRRRPGRPLSDEDMERLGELGGRALIEEIGGAAYKASGPLTAAEKKA